METKMVGNYSIRLHPQHRKMLVALSERTQRKPPDVLRWLLVHEYQRVVSGQEANHDEK